MKKFLATTGFAAGLSAFEGNDVLLSQNSLISYTTVAVQLGLNGACSCGFSPLLLFLHTDVVADDSCMFLLS